MGISHTSLQAYFGEVVKTLGERQQMVLEAFTHKENFTNTELASYLQRPINTITPRVFELRAKGLLNLHCVRPCKVTGRVAKCWKIKERLYSARAETIYPALVEPERELKN